MEWTRSLPFVEPGTGQPTATDTGIANSAHVPGYVPRFYAFASGAPPRMFLGTGQWKNDTGVWTGGVGNPDTLIDTSVYGGNFVVQGLDPSSSWIAPVTITLLQNVAGLLRGAPANMTKIDGLLFSNNAVLLRGGNAGTGQVRSMGAVIAQDVGIQATNGIRIDYDRRVQDLVDFPEATPDVVEAFAVFRTEQ
jgi:hypothetical protein